MSRPNADELRKAEWAALVEENAQLHQLVRDYHAWAMDLLMLHSDDQASLQPILARHNKLLEGPSMAGAARVAIEQHGPREEGEHIWFLARGICACALCGICRVSEGRNEPCPGPAKVTLRKETDDV